MKYLIPLLLTPSALLSVEIPDDWQLDFRDTKLLSLEPISAKKPEKTFGRVEKEEIVWKHKYHKITSFEVGKVDKKHPHADNTATYKFNLEDGWTCVLKVTKSSGSLECKYDEEWESEDKKYSQFERGSFTCKSKE